MRGEKVCCVRESYSWSWRQGWRDGELWRERENECVRGCRKREKFRKDVIGRNIVVDWGKIMSMQ
jgi:hypothetical protein